MSATGAQSPKLTYADYLAKKKRREITHPVVTDADAVTAYKLTEAALKQARLRNEKDNVAQLEAKLADLEEQIRSSSLVMRLRALPREGDNSYAVLKAEHPPQKSDHEDVQQRTGDPKAKARWHSKTFGPALVAACLIEPEVTIEQATDMSQDMNEAEWDLLFGAAIQVNEYATDTAGLVFS